MRRCGVMKITFDASRKEAAVAATCSVRTLKTVPEAE